MSATIRSVLAVAEDGKPVCQIFTLQRTLRDRRAATPYTQSEELTLRTVELLGGWHSCNNYGENHLDQFWEPLYERLFGGWRDSQGRLDFAAGWNSVRQIELEFVACHDGIGEELHADYVRDACRALQLDAETGALVSSPSERTDARGVEARW